MRTIGLIGGMSWESTALYYRIINDTRCVSGSAGCTRRR
jgi:aspartate/glutamate racemase